MPFANLLNYADSTFVVEELRSGLPSSCRDRPVACAPGPLRRPGPPPRPSRDRCAPITRSTLNVLMNFLALRLLGRVLLGVRIYLRDHPALCNSMSSWPASPCEGVPYFRAYWMLMDMYIRHAYMLPLSSFQLTIVAASGEYFFMHVGFRCTSCLGFWQRLGGDL